MRGRIAREAAAVGLVFAAACDTALPAPTYTERDSAGVRIVESVRGAWEGGEGWTVGAEPTLQIGVVEGDPAHQFSSVVGALRMADGRIVVADRTSNELRFFGADGAHLLTVGGPGNGPGEFGQVTRMVPYRGDSILVWDTRGRRVTVFDREGRLGRVQALRLAEGEPQGTGSLQVIVPGSFTGAFADGTLVMSSNLRIALDAGVPFRPRITPQRLTPDGEPQGEMGSFPGPSISMTPPGSGNPAPRRPFPSVLQQLVHGDRMYVGTGETFDIEVRESDGAPVRLIRARDGRDLTVTQEHRDAYMEVLGETLAGGPVENPARDVEFPATLPAYARFLIDAEDHLWVWHYLPAGTVGPSTWSVFDPDGRLLGEVEAPAGLAVEQIGRDFLLGVWTDELDVPYVRMYRLERR